jgi:hypothetical protein
MPANGRRDLIRRLKFNEELYEMYVALNILRVIKSRRLKWVDLVPPMGERRGECGLLAGKPERNNLQHVGLGGRLFQLMLKKKDGHMDWIDRAEFGDS